MIIIIINITNNHVFVIMNFFISKLFRKFSLFLIMVENQELFLPSRNSDQIPQNVISPCYSSLENTFFAKFSLVLKYLI